MCFGRREEDSLGIHGSGTIPGRSRSLALTIDIALGTTVQRESASFIFLSIRRWDHCMPSPPLRPHSLRHIGLHVCAQTTPRSESTKFANGAVGPAKRGRHESWSVSRKEASLAANSDT